MIEQFQKLDDLIVEHTSHPVQGILRNQLALTREQVEAYQAASDRQDATLARQLQTISELERENAQLRAQLKHPPPRGKLDDTSRKALQYFCDCNGAVTVQELAQHLSCQASKAHYICDELSSKGLIWATCIANTDPRWDALGDNSAYDITAEGRKLRIEEAG